MRQNEKAVLQFDMDGKCIGEATGVKVAYISGKITGLPDLNRKKFAAAEELLKSYGYEVINPHTVCNDIPKDAEWDVFMKRCITHLMNADCVFMLDDYMESTGAKLEVVIAHQLGMPAYYLESFEFRVDEKIIGARKKVKYA